MFASVALGTLVDEERLSWEDKVKKHLLEFDPAGDPNIGAEAEIIDLCRHTTGLANPNTAFIGPNGTVVCPGEDHVRLLNALPTSNEHGQRFCNWWLYSSAAFGLVADIVKNSNAAGSNYTQFLKERVLKPLGMNHTLVTEDEYEQNDNIAHSYVKTKDVNTGEWVWSEIQNCSPTERHQPLMACMGATSSVNDLLAFCAAVMNRYDVEEGLDGTNIQPLLNGAKENSLREIQSLWDWYWTRPTDDGFENETAYALGWYKTTMPSGAVGQHSYNNRRYRDMDKFVKPFIIGKDSPPRTLYGHNGVGNGFVATIYILPESHSAVVALSNAADAGDASETTAQILLQALFDMSPKVDLLAALREEVGRTHSDHDAMMQELRSNRNVPKEAPNLNDYVGTFIGLAVCHIDIERRIDPDRLVVVFGQEQNSECELTYYKSDTFSFLPERHDELLAKGLIDWDYYKVGIFEFVREDIGHTASPNASTRRMTGLKWQWDVLDEPTLYVKTTESMERRYRLESREASSSTTFPQLILKPFWYGIKVISHIFIADSRK